MQGVTYWVTPGIMVDLAAEVEHRFGLAPGEITTRCRRRNFVRARQVYFALMRETTDLHLSDIGRSIGTWNHASVIHNITTCHQDMVTDPLMREVYTELKQIVKIKKQ